MGERGVLISLMALGSSPPGLTELRTPLVSACEIPKAASPTVGTVVNCRCYDSSDGFCSVLEIVTVVGGG